VEYQEEQEALEIAHEQSDAPTIEGENGGNKNKVIIPPIPEPPEPPRLEDMEGLSLDKFDDQYPYYFPKGKEEFVAHLDKECFHIVDGRYFGSLSNEIADPHFVGANAPGLSGLNLSVATGLATAQSGGGSSSTILAAASSSATQGGSVGGPSNSAALPKTPGSSSKTTPKSKPPPLTPALVGAGGGEPSLGGESASVGGGSSINGGTSSATKKKNSGLPATASSSQLRKIMEDGGPKAEEMKTWIIRAAVHASRSSRHGHSFKAPDGELYPDVSKAFAAHAGLKPCIRCKNNKQGAYHCRLRRKHKDLDYDGSNSPSILAPLFQESMDSLLKSP
jgi:hypothetical protein